MSNKAGGSAQLKYRELRKEWLRRNGKLFARAAVLFVLVGALWNYVYLAVWPHPWVAGFMSGALVAMWLGMREFTPDWIDNWMFGADGEKKTKRRLDQLPSGWSVEHDIQTGHGNLDHLVIGPGGVFVLDSKAWKGTLTVVGDQATLTRWGDRNDWTGSAGAPVTRLAMETRDRIKERTRISQFVTPVIVFWGDFPAGCVDDGSVAFVHGDKIVDWLTTRPAVIHESVLGRIGDAAVGGWMEVPGE